MRLAWRAPVPAHSLRASLAISHFALPPRVSRHLSLRLLEEHPRADARAAVRVEGEHVL